METKRLGERRTQKYKPPVFTDPHAQKTNINPGSRRRVPSPYRGGLVLLLNPLTQAERGVKAKDKHEVAGEGTPAFAPGTGARRKKTTVQ